MLRNENQSLQERIRLLEGRLSEVAEQGDGETEVLKGNVVALECKAESLNEEVTSIKEGGGGLRLNVAIECVRNRDWARIFSCTREESTYLMNAIDGEMSQSIVREFTNEYHKRYPMS